MTVNNVNNNVTPAALVDILSKLMGMLSLNEANFGMVLTSMNNATSSFASVMEKNQKDLENITDNLNGLNTWTNEVIIPGSILTGLGTVSALAEGPAAASAGMGLGIAYLLPNGTQSVTSMISAGMQYSQAEKSNQLDIEKNITDQQSKENDRLADTITGTESTKNIQAEALNDIVTSIVPMSKLRI